MATAQNPLADRCNCAYSISESFADTEATEMSSPPKPATNVLILLVGSNSLPNYLAACALRPERVVYLYTNEVKEPMQRLRRAIQAALPGIEAD